MFSFFLVFVCVGARLCGCVQGGHSNVRNVGLKKKKKKSGVGGGSGESSAVARGCPW